jgi:glycerate kinase
VSCPLADGGEGTLSVILSALGGEYRAVASHDALGRPITARFGLIDNGRTAIVEAASAVGLPMIAEADRDPEASTTSGVGELIAAAIAAGVERVVLGVGGVATTDGGRGAIEVLGDGLGAVHMTVLCDVQTGFEDAAEVFGPQKGADVPAVLRLAERLNAYAAALPRDPRGMPMTGAAGGLAGGLWAAFGAELVAGAEHLLRLLDFDSLLSSVDVVITGEGCFDQQSLNGKLVGTVKQHASSAGVPCCVVTGRSEWSHTPAGVAALVIASRRADLVKAGQALAARTDLHRSR